MPTRADAELSAARQQLRQLARRLVPGALGGTAAGWVLAAVTLLIDRAAGTMLPIGLDNARALLAAFVGAVLTIGVFTLWMRTVVVSLAASEVSPRVVASYLDDAFQRTVAIGMVAAFSYVVAVVAFLPQATPTGTASPGVPAVSAVTSVLLVVASLLSVLLAMRHAVVTLSPSHLVHVITEQALDVMRHPPGPDDPVPAHLAQRRVVRRVVAQSMGWVQHIDYDAMITAIPARTTVMVPSAMGDFVIAGETVATVDTDVDDDTLDRIGDAITLAPTRRPDVDLAFAIQQLVDVAQHAISPGSNDTSTGIEALLHVRAVLDALIRNGTFSGCLEGDEGRCIVSPDVWHPADHLEATFERLRSDATAMPLIIEQLLGTIDLLEQTADEVDDRRSLGVLRQQRDRLHQATAETDAPADR